MHHFSQWILEPTLTLKVASIMRPLIEELVYLARTSSPFGSAVHASTGVPIALEYNIRFASALSKLCRASPACFTAAKVFFGSFDVLRPIETLWPLLQKEQSTPSSDRDLLIFEHASGLIIEVLRTTWRLVKLSSFSINQASLLSLLHKFDAADPSSASLASLLIPASSSQASDMIQRVLALASHSLEHALGLSDAEKQTSLTAKHSQHSAYLSMVDEEDSSEYQLMLASASWATHGDSSCDSVNTVYTNANSSTKILTSSDLQSGLVDVSGFLLQSNNSPDAHHHPNARPLIITPTTSHNLEALALAIGNEKPVLLQGPTGSGKSALISHVANLVKRELTTIHIGDALDGKSLLGGYVATEVPGQFKWVEGPLTRAVVEGHWLVIEDLDLASSEVYGILQPLVQSRQLFIPSRAETIHADHGFSLFATATTASLPPVQPSSTDSAELSSTTTRNSHAAATSAASTLTKLQQSSSWTQVVIDPLNSAELAQVIDQGYGLGQLASRMVATHESLVVACAREGISLRATERPLTTRDCLRWATRVRSAFISKMRSSISGITDADAFARLAPGNVISSGLCELVVREGFDIYISPSQNATLTEARMDKLSLGWTKLDRAKFLFDERPTIEPPTETTCLVGRSTIPVNTNPKTITPPLSTLREVFVPTTRSVKLLEWLSMAVEHNEPVLLVGETGGGKTSTIQHLAARTRRKLVVLNMSQSSDTVDLLGGFKPIELSMLATPLKRIFERLFIKTFSKTKNQEFIDRVLAAHTQKDWRALAGYFVKSCKLANSKFEQRRAQEQAAASSLPAVGSSPPPRDPKRRKDTEELDEETLKQAFAGFDDLDADTFPFHLPSEHQWRLFNARVQRFGSQVEGTKAFQFVEGALVKAVQRGEWVLLDEINLASAETLECLSGLLEGESLVLTERGDAQAIPRHNDFRLFAAMNPANDVGKSNLPAALRARFSEFYLSELEDRSDLAMIVNGYLQRVNPKPPALSIVDFYLNARKESENRLVDGSNQKPRFNLRSLSRALEYCADTTNLFGFDRALFEGIQLAFLTQLNTASYDIMNKLIHQSLRPKSLNDKMLKTPPSLANFQRSANSASNISTSFSHPPVTFEQFILESGPQEPFKDPRFIVTQTTQKHLTHLARALTTRKYPLLLQGPTSAGKTSMIEYLAKLTGHRFVRVNNSEQTDLQEYLGQYIHDSQGRLVYHDGVLVEALRHGHWIVLDELNLAPSEVLEALNRLLDDNRQLYVPELQEYITPHPHFCLFATQNPPGLYGGRKVLSRAFRSRFLELHIDDIPDAELQLILEQRSHLPASYCQRLVAIMKDLQRQRQGTQVFAGRHGFVTLRDLFRWAERHPTTYEELAIHGYFLLADRLREIEEREIVRQVLQKHLKVDLNLEAIYEEIWRKAVVSGETDAPVGQQSIVWTAATKRLFGLMGICLRHKEPILLVGPPGTGKTAISQLHAELLNQHLEILNCHQNSEAADFIGGLRPVRGKDSLEAQLASSLKEVFVTLRNLFEPSFGAIVTSSLTLMGMDEDQIAKTKQEIESQLMADGSVPSTAFLERLMNVLPRLKISLNEQKKSFIDGPDYKQLHNNGLVLQSIDNAEHHYAEFSAMFLWYDGPLVRTMKRGQAFLVDEISLAEDAVLERLNSVLEPSRLLVLAEKGGREIEELIAHPDFRIIATMNPGGDFGKKELSPALRNRFTEIFVPAVDQREDLIHIILKRLHSRRPTAHSENMDGFADCIVDFVEYFSGKTNGSWSYSLRDILAWVDFIATTTDQLGARSAYLHGVSMLVLDGLGITNPLNADSLKRSALEFLNTQSLPEDSQAHIAAQTHPNAALTAGDLVNTDEKFGLGTFTIPKTPGMDIAQSEVQLESYSMKAPTTLSNLLRLLRALQLPKPLLLEGSPGVGKTTIVEALGAASGRKVVRINLSEQTDMLDLLGADLPVEDDAESLRNLSDAEATTSTAKFEWRDGVFLNALKNGDWVLLDELNLANQSVLEGLNAVLDHRGTVFIPELNASFVCPPTFRIFAAQNPTAQGGGRKGLPKSFLNRFTKVYLDSFTTSDLNYIANALFPELGPGMISHMVDFNTEVYRATMETFAFGRDGAPWEFNLRDILRWCKLVKASTERIPDAFVQLLYLQRFRTETDRAQVAKLFEKCFSRPLVYATRFPHYQLTPSHLQVGQAILPRVLHPYKENVHGSHHGAAAVEDQPPILLQHLLPSLESLMKCVEFNWLAILVGPTASGKTSLLKLLAWLTGNHLSTFSVNPSVDTLEILGGFEQIDLNRHAKKLIERISQLVSYITRLLLQPGASPSAMPDAFHLATMWNLFQSQANNAGSESSFSGKSIFASESQLRLTTQLLDLLDAVISRMPSSTNSDIISMGIDSTDTLRAAVTKIGALEAKSVAGSFEWVDGLLIDAMIHGHWIVMDNVNTCPGPVLDRLLPLLEPNGILRLNERGLVDGQVSEIVPHPNFRIFFTMDPKYGDISRAMRNRGIEIGMTALPTEAGSPDMTSLLARSLQLYAPSLFERMTHFHNSIGKHSYPHLKSTNPLPIDTTLGLTHLMHWAELTLDQLQRGETIGEALKLSMEQVYARGQPLPATRALLRSHFLNTFADLDLGAHQSQLKQQLTSSPGFSDKLKMANPEAAAFSLVAHSKVLLGAIAAPVVAGTPCFFALEQLLLSGSMASLQHWVTSMSAFIASNSAVLLGDDTEGNALNVLTEWMAEAFRTSETIQQAQDAVNACVNLLLDPNKKDSQSWMQILAVGEGVTSARRNVSFWRMLDSLSRQSDEALKVYTAACISLDRVRLWCLTLPQQFYQLQVMKKVTDSSFSNASLASHSIIEQSLALALRKITKTSLTHPIAALMTSFFSEFDAILSRAILDNSGDGEPMDALHQDLQLAIKLRHHLWRWLVEMPAEHFQVREFVPPFNWLIKAIRQLQTSFAPRFALSDAMEVIISHMNKIVSEELGMKYKPTLWKRAGHPSALKNAELFTLQSQLNSLTVSHKASLKDSHGTVLRALSTLMWINTFPESQSVQAKVKALFSSISHVPEAVQKTLSEASNPLADVAGSSQRQADQQAELKFPLIAPIFDLHLIQLEVFIVQQVQELLNSCQAERSIPNIGARLASLVPVIQHLLQKAAEHTTTPPRMQAGYQLLHWLIDSNGAAASAKDSAATSTFTLLQSLFSELHTNLGERRLYNSVGDTPLVVPAIRDQSTFLPPIVIELQKKAIEKDMTYRELLDAGMELTDLNATSDANVSYQPNDANILRLQSAYRTAYTMSRLTEWKQVPVVSKHVRMQQMETLLTFLSQSESEQDPHLVTDGHRASECDWSLLVDTLCITAQCFSPDASVASTIAFLPELFKQLLREASLENLERSLALVDIIASLPSQSNDSRFVDLGARHVVEICAALAKMIKYSHNFWSLVSSSAGVSNLPAFLIDQHLPRLLAEPVVKLWRGCFQMELALLRATLVIPSQPIDVSTKYASRALIIEQMKAQVETRLAVLLESERRFTGAPSNFEIEKERKLLTKIDDLLALAKERQLSRPENAPAFHTLWSHIHSLFQSHCDHSRYMEIVKNFNTILSLPRSIVATQWPALLLREAQVQNNLTQAISGLQSQFLPYFPDVVGPFINCVFELKSALRLIRFATEMMMPSSLLLGSTSVDAVSNMMTSLQLEEETAAEIKRKAATGPETAITLYGPALSASPDSMYSLASHLQQVVTKLVEVPRSLSLHDISLVLSKTTFEAVTALARLNQARAQAAVTESQLQQPLTKGNSLAAKMNQWMLSASRTSSILQLQSSLLRSSLNSVFDQMRTQGFISQEAYDSLDRIFTVFVETYQAAKAEEEKKKAAEAEFYKYKTRDNKVEHQHDVDEANFKSMFPDYYAEFEDILGPQRGATLDPHAPMGQPPARPPRDDDDDDNDDEGEDAYKRKKAAEEAADNNPAVIFQGQIYQLNDGEVYQLCRTHFKVFSVLRTYLQPGVQEVADATDFDELEELEAAISAKKKGKQRSAAAAEWLNSAKTKRQLSERSHTFMSAYETATKLVNLMGEVLPRGEQDSALEGAHILALQQCIDQLTANWRNPEKEKSKKKVSKQKRLAARQRRLEAAKAAVVTSFMSSHELVHNFYTVPNAGEASLLQEPLSLFQQRLEDLLATNEIGVNEILITIWKLVTRLLEANVSMPLMHFVTGLELLIERSHDWEDNQPARYTIREHMNACAKFITRWRAMELQFWPQILVAKEQQFQLSGSKWWFFLYSLLHESAAKARALDTSNAPLASGMDTDAEDASQLDLNGLLTALQEYIENSTYGEFPTRLHLLVSFYYQFQAEASLSASTDGSTTPVHTTALVTMIYNVYRYYAQFLPLLQVEMFKLKEAVQMKLEEFIKISRWDDASFYRLRLTTQASHRNLMKFTKQYEVEVLSLPFKGFLEIVSTNESLEQLKKEAPQAVIVSSVKLGQKQPGAHVPSSKSLVSIQSLSDMKQRSQQLVVPSTVGNQIFNLPMILPHPSLQLAYSSSNAEKTALHMRLSSLFAKVSKHSGKLLPQQFEFAHRSHIQLENLTTELIEGILEMRAVAETPLKKRAFANMLSELKSIGLDHHKTAVKAVLKQQLLVSANPNASVIDVNALHDLPFLFREPVCEEVVSKLLLVAADHATRSSAASASERSVSILTEALDTFWSKSDDYFYKLLAQVLLLRSKANSHSTQLTRSEANQSLGFADHVFALVVHQRRTMCIALERHESVEKLATAVSRLALDLSSVNTASTVEDDGSANNLTNDLPSHVLPAQAPLRRALMLQKGDLDSLLALSTSMSDLVRTIAASPSAQARNQLSDLLDTLSVAISGLTESRTAVESELSAHTQTSSLSRVISSAASTDSSALVMGPQSYFALVSSDAQIASVTDKLASQCAGVVPRFLPHIVRFRAHRDQVIQQRDSSLALLLNISSEASVASEGDEKAKAFLTEFLQHFNAAVESLLLSVQKVYKIEKQRISSESKLIEERRKQAEDHKAALAQDSMDVDEAQQENAEDDGSRADGHFDSELNSETDRFLPLDLVSSMKHLDSLTVALDAPRILSNFSAASSLLAGFVDSMDASVVPSGLSSPSASVVRLGASLLHQFYPLLKQWSSLHMAHVHNRAILCKSSSKFAHVLVSCMASIMKDGFCIKPPASEGDAAEGETQNDMDGVGLGEGEGDKDVTDQFDEEEQLLGDKPLNDLKKEDTTEDPSKPPVDPDTGAEMENDFDGEMRDVEQKEKDKNQPSDDEESEEGDLMDREMGDLDPEQEEVLDEKLWDDEDDDDDKDGKDGKESYEKNAPIEGNDNDEKEMEARLDDEPAGDQDDKQDQKQGKKKDPKKSGDDEDGDEDGEEDGPEKAENAGDEDDAPEEDDPIRNQDEERYEDSHHKKPHAEEEEFELPEDMNLDGEDDKKGEEEDGKMDLDDDEDEGEGEGDKKGDEPLPFPEKTDTNDEEAKQSEEEEDPTKEGEEDQGEQEDDQKPPEDDPTKEDSPEDDNGIGSSARALDDDEGENNEDEGENPEEEREKVGQSKDDGKDYSEAFGITDEKSLPQQSNVKTSEENKQLGGGQDNDMQSSANEETSDPNATASSSGASGATSVKPTPSKPNPKDDPNAPKNSSEQQKQAPTQQKDANPLRSLGDALKHWERQLNVIEDRPDQSEDDANPEDAAPKPQDDGAMDADKNQTFEFARQDEQADQQTLGIASEEQAEAFKPEDYQMAMEEDEKKDEEALEKQEAEKMDVDENTADPEQNTTVESKSRAPSNRIQTATEDAKEDEKTDADDDAAKDANKDDKDAEGDREDGEDDEEKNYESFASKPQNKEKEDGSGMEIDVPLEPRVDVELTPEDIMEMRMELEQTLATWKADPANLALGGEIWRQLQALTNGAAQQLCEQLRLLLEPTLKSKMQGDYRTGKRLNMRRVVTYVASQFRKDKIWLRRTQPNKRTYQVLLCLDDSQSVLLGNAAPLMREATATLCLALQRLQIGQIGLLKFGQDVDLLHPFSTPFTDEAASVIMPQLTFEQNTTNMENLMRTSIQLLEMSRHEAVMSMGSASATTMQLMFVIGDGRFGDKRQELASWLHRAQQNNIFVVFLIMDTLDKDQSILDIQSVSYTGGKMAIQPYIDDFPFSYYIILKHLDNLPHILSDALRQWFEMVNQNDRR